MECKKCNHTDFYEIEKENANGYTYFTVYCKNCDSYVKHGRINQEKDTRKSEEYKREYMEKQTATKKQEWYIRNVIQYTGEILNKWQASQIINKHKQ